MIGPHHILNMIRVIVWGEKVVVRRVSILTALVESLIQIMLSS